MEPLLGGGCPARNGHSLFPSHHGRTTCLVLVNQVKQKWCVSFKTRELKKQMIPILFLFPCDAGDPATADPQWACHRWKRPGSQSHRLEEMSPVIGIPDFGLHSNNKNNSDCGWSFICTWISLSCHLDFTKIMQPILNYLKLCFIGNIHSYVIRKFKHWLSVGNLFMTTIQCYFVGAGKWYGLLTDTELVKKSRNSDSDLGSSTEFSQPYTNVWCSVMSWWLRFY